MEKRYVGAIDIGTQSVRIIIFDEKGNQIVQKRKISAPYYSLEPGWAEVPKNQFWEDLCEISKAAMAELGADKQYIKALSVTANRDNIIALDEQNEPLRDWIIWIDQRRVPEAVRDLKKSAKGMQKVVYALGKRQLEILADRSKMNWFKYHEPETYRKAKKYLTLCGHIVFHLTGEFADAKGMQCGALPFDAAKMAWHSLPLVYEAVGATQDQLATLYDAGEKMGTVTAKAAEETGLPEGLAIVASGGDKQCETLGSGCFDTKKAAISYGTMATIALSTDKYVTDKNLKFYTWPSSMKGYWNPEFNIYRGYWLVTWFCRQYAKEKDFPSLLAQMNEEAQKIPAGANGLFVFPFWTPHSGLYPDGKGAVMGWTDAHTEVDFYKAILESIAYALREGLELMEKKTKEKVEKLYVMGGGSASDVAVQLTADVFNLKVSRLQTTEISAVGAAINAGIYAGFYGDHQAGVQAMVREEKVFEPISQNVAVYEDIYRNVYLKCYENQRALFQVLDRYVPRDGEKEAGL